VVEDEVEDDLLILQEDLLFLPEDVETFLVAILKNRTEIITTTFREMTDAIMMDLEAVQSVEDVEDAEDAEDVEDVEDVVVVE